MREALEQAWEGPGTDVRYQFTRSLEDAGDKARRAADDGTDIVLACGGDGTVSEIGRALIGTETTLGVLPAGSGNGFARHFEIPLGPARAALALADGRSVRIDVGTLNGRPFLVTCSIAWDAALVRSFEKMPVRGILPYVFAGVQEFFQYKPQPVEATLDTGERLRFPAPLVFTMANLSEYGGGAKIAPHARADDGKIELVVVRHQDVPSLLGNLGLCFAGKLRGVPGVVSRSVSSLTLSRRKATPVQMDGELTDAPTNLTVTTLPKALRILVPRRSKGAA